MVSTRLCITSIVTICYCAGKLEEVPASLDPLGTELVEGCILSVLQFSGPASPRTFHSIDQPTGALGFRRYPTVTTSNTVMTFASKPSEKCSTPEISRSVLVVADLEINS